MDSEKRVRISPLQELDRTKIINKSTNTYSLIKCNLCSHISLCVCNKCNVPIYCLHCKPPNSDHFIHTFNCK